MFNFFFLFLFPLTVGKKPERHENVFCQGKKAVPERNNIMFVSDPINRLINELMKLPTIGPKTARRLAYYIIKTPKEDVEKFIRSLVDVKEKIRRCKICFNFTEKEICDICNDENRDKSQICVVASAKDIPPVEKIRTFRGKYHVLGGLISPLDGVGPDHLTIKNLLKRAKEESIKEIIIATDSDTSGEITAMYIAKMFTPFQIKVTRLAYGLPMGASLEYADEITLSRALEGRRELKG